MPAEPAPTLNGHAPQLLLTPRQTAQILAISERTLWDLTRRAEIPCVRIGRCVRYSYAALQQWVEER